MIFSEEILVSMKLFARNSGPGNGCANFMGAWDFGFFLQENLHAHKIPRFGGRGWVFFFGGGGCANFIFMGVGIFGADVHDLFKFSSYKMGVSMNSWFLVTGRIYFKKKVFKYI